jgi:hypothetical protein
MSDIIETKLIRELEEPQLSQRQMSIIYNVSVGFIDYCLSALIE